MQRMPNSVTAPSLYNYLQIQSFIREIHFKIKELFPHPDPDGQLYIQRLFTHLII